MNTIFEAKYPLSPRPFVFSTAKSAARKSALRSLVPGTISEAIASPSRFATSTRTSLGPASVKRMS